MKRTEAQMTRAVRFGLLFVAASVGVYSPALAAPSTFTVSGPVPNTCKIGTGSFVVSINWVKNASAQITLDGTAGNTQTTNGGTTTATHSYTTFCNGPKTLTMTLPTAAINYTITVKDNAGTTVATATSSTGSVTANVAIPVTTLNWTLTAAATYANGGSIVTGTYSATVTIQ